MIFKDAPFAPDYGGDLEVANPDAQKIAQASFVLTVFKPFEMRIAAAESFH